MNVTHNGQTQTLTQWGASLGIDRTTIRKRLKAGWSIADALNPKDTRGIHQIGRKWPEWVRKKISAALKRKGRGNQRARFVSLDALYFDTEPRAQISDSLVYADPLEILCAVETAGERLASHS